MEMTGHLNQSVYNVTMSGNFTFNDHQEFRTILAHISAPDNHKIVLYMSQVEFIDSAALGMLLLARDEAEKHKKQLVISSPSGQVKKIFDMARFATLFTITEANH